MKGVTRSIVVSLFLVGLTGPLYAQTTPAVNSAQEAEAPFQAGSLDLMVGFGFGGFLYPHIEPNVDVGMVPIGKDFAISLGGGADFGYCVLCAGLSALTAYSVSSSYISPFGRVAFHFGTLGGLLANKPTIDLYAGTYAGPTFYTFNWKQDDRDVEYKQTTTSFMIGPMLGVRLGFGDQGRWLLYGEYRIGLEVGFEETSTVTTDGTELIADNDFRRGGSDFAAGVGIRF